MDRKTARKEPIVGMRGEPVDITNRMFKVGMALLIGVVVLCFARTVRFEYVDWDDLEYVAENRELGPFGADQVRREFTRNVMGNYHPVTMLSYSVEILFAGKHPGLMHATNVLLHAINALLAAVLVRRMTGRRALALLAATLWALNPMRVESVAWVSARKDLLMLLFGLLMLLSYLRWLRSQEAKWLVVAHVLFILACLSKAMAVAFMPTLLLVHMWSVPGRLRWAMLKDKVVFLVLAIIFGVVAVRAQADLGVIANVALEGRQRAIVGAANLVIYTALQTVPVGLSAFYGYPLDNGHLPAVYAPAAVVALVFLFFIVRGAIRGKVFWLAAAFMVINLVLVLQWLPVGQAVRADRYTYAAGIGHALMLALALDYALSRWRLPVGRVLWTAGAAALALSARTIPRLDAWKDSVAVRTDMIEYAPKNFVFYMDRSISWERAHRPEEALADLNTAVRLRPKNDYKPFFVRGAFLAKTERYREAMADFLEVYKRVPTHPGLLPNMLYAQRKLGLCHEVERNATAALELDPKAIDILNLRALCRNAAGETDSAWIDVRRSLKVDPRNEQTLLIGAVVRTAVHDTAGACLLMDRMRGTLLVDAELDSLHSVMVRTCSGHRRGAH